MKKINWDSWFYEKLGYRIVESKEDKKALNLAMKELIKTIFIDFCKLVDEYNYGLTNETIKEFKKLQKKWLK